MVQAVIAEDNEAIEMGLSGVPAVRVADTDLVVMGAQPLATYRRWVERLLTSEGGPALALPAC